MSGESCCKLQKKDLNIKRAWKSAEVNYTFWPGTLFMKILKSAYAYFQAKNIGSQAPKTILHPCPGEKQNTETPVLDEVSNYAIENEMKQRENKGPEYLISVTYIIYI